MKDDSPHPARWWHREPDGRFQCDLCPHACLLGPGQRGLCFARQATDRGLVLTSHGRSSGFCIDPIEKKPLNHFFPGSSVLSFGTIGCNLGCTFCQNWDISKVRQQERLQDEASPSAIARAAQAHRCASVAFTYNEPIIFAEYAIDTAQACHDLGIHTVAVTAGYIAKGAMAEFFGAMDAANIDLKSFSDDFYRKWCNGRLGPVLDALQFAVKEAGTWVEITTLLIPGANDSPQELDALTRWVHEALGPSIPLHFTAFHPAYKVLELPRTSLDILREARRIALGNGLMHVYTGNVQDPTGSSTWCPGCGNILVEREGYRIGRYGLELDCCQHCGTPIAGRFGRDKGSWGPWREPLRLKDR